MKVKTIGTCQIRIFNCMTLMKFRKNQFKTSNSQNLRTLLRLKKNLKCCLSLNKKIRRQTLTFLALEMMNRNSKMITTLEILMLSIMIKWNRRVNFYNQHHKTTLDQRVLQRSCQHRAKMSQPMNLVMISITMITILMIMKMILMDSTMRKIRNNMNWKKLQETHLE